MTAIAETTATALTRMRMTQVESSVGANNNIQRDGEAPAKEKRQDMEVDQPEHPPKTQPEELLPPNNTNNKQEREDISWFITPFNAKDGDILEYNIANKGITTVLGLMKGPNNTKDHKGYLYAIQSSHLSDIEAAYQALQNNPPDDSTGKQ